MRAIENRNEEYLQNPPSDVEIIRVAGAGQISISKEIGHSTGGAFGFGFGVSWSRHGIQCGGVLGKDEAMRLALIIIEACKNEPLSELELIEKRTKEFYEYGNKL